MSTLLFVYGTLKEGFPNHALNQGRRIPGRYRTRQPYPLYVVELHGEARAPWLVDRPGEGLPVVGEVFQVDAAALAVMDALEEVGRPTGYVRTEIELEPVDAAGQAFRAFAYLKPHHPLALGLTAQGPFAEYTHDMAAGYRLAGGGMRPPRPETSA